MSQWDSDSSERLLFGMTQLLRSAGDARAVSVLLNAVVDVEWDRYDNWNGGLYYVTVILQVDYLTFGQLDAEEKGRLTATFAEVAQPILPLSENDTFQGVRISPTGRPSAGWREEAAAWISGVGVTNQGRVRSDNIATREVDGLLFRSDAEVNLYRALKRRGVTFAPLPVFLRGGGSYARLEPDFIVIKDGIVYQVEVDGDTYHRESPVDAQRRTAPMEYEGVKVRRYAASQLANEAAANEVVDGLLRWIEKEKANR